MNLEERIDNLYERVVLMSDLMEALQVKTQIEEKAINQGVDKITIIQKSYPGVIKLGIDIPKDDEPNLIFSKNNQNKVCVSYPVNTQLKKKVYPKINQREVIIKDGTLCRPTRF